MLARKLKMHFILKRIKDFNVWLKTFKFEFGIEDIHIIYLCWNKVLSGGIVTVNWVGLESSWWNNFIADRKWNFFYVEVIIDSYFCFLV